MGKRVVPRNIEPSDDAPELDILRAIAGYPVRGIHLSKHQMRSRVVLIQRDQFDRVIGSTERIEETEYLDVDGQWSQ